MSDLTVLRQAHVERSVLPDLLERVADDLPHPGTDLTADICLRIDELVPLHHDEDEHAFFPILLEACRDSDAVASMIAVLRQEHEIERQLAHEVAMHLQDHLAGCPSIGADALGYALRNLFELQRRHLMWESTILLPLTQERLDADDRRALSHLLHRVRGTAELRRCGGECENCHHIEPCERVEAVYGGAMH